MRPRKRLIPPLRRAHSSPRKIPRLCNLPIPPHLAALFRRDIAVVTATAGCGTVCYVCAGKVFLGGGGVDA